MFTRVALSKLKTNFKSMNHKPNMMEITAAHVAVYDAEKKRMEAKNK